MAKKRQLPIKAAQKAAAPKVNPFELKRTKSKFNVIGRRLKGSTKNVVEARQEANNRVRIGGDGALAGRVEGCKWCCMAWCAAVPARRLRPSTSVLLKLM